MSETMATSSKTAETLEKNTKTEYATQSLNSAAIPSTSRVTKLTQEQLERMETNRKRALEIRKSKQSQENPAKMLEFFKLFSKKIKICLV